MPVYKPSRLSGTMPLPLSKSRSHRRLILAALEKKPLFLKGIDRCDDVDATIAGLSALHVDIRQHEDGFFVDGRKMFSKPPEPVLVRQSASTLRFLVPVCALKADTYTFYVDPVLKKRGIDFPYLDLDVYDDHCVLHGGLQAGRYDIDISNSSQYASGLLMALSSLPEPSEIVLRGDLSSLPYIRMTAAFFKRGVIFHGRHIFIDHAIFQDIGPKPDASAQAYLIAARHLGQRILFSETDDEYQADTLMARLDLNKPCELSLKDCPDLLPPLALALAIGKHRHVLRDIRRLKYKESDRPLAVAEILNAMGADISLTDNAMIIQGVNGLHGAAVHTHHDHRLALMAVFAASVATGDTIIDDDRCIAKSWPEFLAGYEKIGGRRDEF